MIDWLICKSRRGDRSKTCIICIYHKINRFIRWNQKEKKSKKWYKLNNKDLKQNKNTNQDKKSNYTHYIKHEQEDILKRENITNNLWRKGLDQLIENNSYYLCQS